MKYKLRLYVRILFIIAGIASSVSCIKVLNDLNMLPTRLFNIILISFIAANVINIILFLFKRLGINLIGLVLTIGIVGVSIFGVNHGTKIANFLNKSFGNNGIEITGYNVAVLKSSDFESIHDLRGKSIGYFSLEDNKEALLEKVNGEIKADLKEYSELKVLYNDLINKDVDSMILSEGFLEMLEEQYEHIYDLIKIIHNIEIEQKIEVEETTPPPKLDPVNVLISGSDSRSGMILNKTRSDVNMIVTIDPNNHKLLLTSIPRDYYVQLHGTSGTKDKLTHAGVYGIEMTKTTLEDVFNIKLDYTVKVGFQSVIKVVDLIGGIDIYSEVDVYCRTSDGGAEPVQIYAGNNHLNGAQALAYARERKGYAEGDNHRVQNQQQVIEAIIAKVSGDKSLIMRYDELLSAFSELYRTDIPAEVIQMAVKLQLDTMPSWTVERQQVSGYGTYAETYSMGDIPLWVMIPDEGSVQEARNRIMAIIDGVQE